MTSPVAWKDVVALLPELFLVAWASGLLLLDVLYLQEKRHTAWLWPCSRSAAWWASSWPRISWPATASNGASSTCF